MSQFINKKKYLPLFWKFTIAITVVVLIFGSTNYVLIHNSLINTMEKELHRRMIFMSKTLSEEITNNILWDNYLTIQTIINTAKANDTTIKYILITDNNEKIIAHSFESYLPEKIAKHYKCKDSCKAERDFPAICYNHTLNLTQISMPLLDGNLGYLYIGIDTFNISTDTKNSMQLFLVMIFSFFIIGIAGAFAFSYLITKPIKLLEKFSNQTNLDTLNDKNIEIFNTLIDNNLFFINSKFKDEIDKLIETYREMLIRLTKKHKELQNLQSDMIHIEKISTIGVLAAGLAHDINNPIAGVLNSISRIRKNLSNTEQTLKYLDLMEESAQKINIVIKNLMNFARKNDIEFEQVDLHSIIENAILLVSHKLDESKITINKKYEDSNCIILGSRHHLEQVFVNLFLNSIYAIDLKSKLFPNYSEKFIEISVERNDGLIITVTDNGLGIEEEKLNFIFETFYTTKKNEGTGLGLSIVQNILNLHNASIAISSKYEEWTVVSIKFNG